EVTPVHPAKLVVCKIPYFIGHGGCSTFFHTAKFMIHKLLVTFIPIVPHAWKRVSGFHARIILLLNFTSHFIFVFPLDIQVAGCYKIFAGRFLGKERTVKYGPVTVL